MSKLTQTKFSKLTEDFPTKWKKSDVEGLKKHVEKVFSEYESQYIFYKCYFHEDTIHIMIFSEGNAFIKTVDLEDEPVDKKEPPKMSVPTVKPWYVRFWS